MNKLIYKLKQIYYRSKLDIWSIFNLPPPTIFVADTKIEIPARNWMVAIPCRTATTRIERFGRNKARYFYEPDEMEWFRKMIAGRKVFFDVGSNVGWYSYLAASDNKERKIVAFEFMREYAQFTRRAFAMNGINGEVVNKGVGLTNRVSHYHDPFASVDGGLISLDDFSVQNNLWPDYLKMDIEGFELDALEGARKILEKRPTVQISIHDQYLEERGQSGRQVLDLLAEYGYRVVWNMQDAYFMAAD